MDTKFQRWLMNHKPDDNMLWKDAFWHTYCFWRDEILPMFTDPLSNKICNCSELLKGEIDRNTDVIGEHRSKSIVNPVVRITYRGVEIVFRYNFYDYEVAAISSKPIELPMEKLFFSKEANFFYQGFPKEYQIEDRYEDNNCTFIVKIGNHYRFYTFMFLLWKSICTNERLKDREDNNPFFTDVPGVGNLDLEEILVDGICPIFFTLISGKGQRYISMCCEFFEEQRWVITPISNVGLIKLLTNKLSMKDAFFTQSNEKCIIAHWSKDNPVLRYEEVAQNELPQQDLPIDETLEAEEDEFEEYIQKIKNSESKSVLEGEIK